MSIAIYDVSLAYDQIVKRGIPGQVATVTDAVNDLPVEEILDLEGNPLAALVSNPQGYVQGFQVIDGPPLVKLSVGSASYTLMDLQVVGQAAQDAQAAAAAAEAAAGLVTAPPDSVMALILSNLGSDSAAAVRAQLAAEAGTADGLITPGDKQRALHSASYQILDLARKDGWSAVYDPANPETLTLDESGNVLELRDGLAQSPAFIADSTVKPTLRREPFAQMFGGTVFAQGDFGLTATYGAICVIETPNIAPGSSNQYVLSGNNASERLSFSINGTTGITRVGNGSILYGTRPNVPGRHVWDVKVNGMQTEFTQDGHYGYRGTAGGGMLGIPTSFRMGGFGLVGGAPTNAWAGGYGLLLLHPNPTVEVMNRMRKLVMSLASVRPSSPNYWPEVRSLTLDGNDNIVVCNGDPDTVMGASIMSITKTITALTARQYLTTDTLLDQTFALVEDDAFYWGTESVFQVGDVVSFRDLLYAAALPSNDLAPRAIARRVAEIYIPGSEPAVKRFLKKLNQNLADWGYFEANASAVGGGGKLSLRQTADVIRRMTKDPVLRGIFGTRTKTLSIAGPNARTVDIRHTIDSGTASAYPFTEFIAGKTGTGRGRQHVAAAWTHPDGGEYITVVLGVLESETTHNRYIEMYRGILAARNSEQSIVLANNKKSGVAVNSTSTLDVTDLFTGMYRTPYADSGVYLIRTGTTVMLSFYDVGIAAANFSKLTFMPEGFTPQMSVFDVVIDQESGKACYLRVSDQGSVQVGNPANAVIRGSITYPVMPTDDFPAPPFPGFAWQRV